MALTEFEENDWLMLYWREEEWSWEKEAGKIKTKLAKRLCYGRNIKVGFGKCTGVLYVEDGD